MTSFKLQIQRKGCRKHEYTSIWYEKVQRYKESPALLQGARHQIPIH